VGDKVVKLDKVVTAKPVAAKPVKAAKPVAAKAAKAAKAALYPPIASKVSLRTPGLYAVQPIRLHAACWSTSLSL